MKSIDRISNKIHQTVAAVFMVSLLLSSCISPLMGRASAATLKPTAQISFTFDDAEASAYTLAAAALKKYGYSGVEFVATGCVGMTTAPNTCPADPLDAYMTWAQINELKTTYGWEIASHTVNHPLLASTDPIDQPVALTKAQVIAELLNSKNAINTNTGITPISFATPYGDYQPSGNPVLSEIAKLYANHRGFADIGQNVFPYNDYLLVDQPIQGDVPVATVKAYIDQAIANKTWLVLTFHHIKAAGASALKDDYEYNAADLEAIAAYAQSKGLLGTSLANGYASNSGNLLSNASFDTAITAKTGVVATDNLVWNTDSIATIKQDTANNGSYPSPANSVSFTSGATSTHLWSPLIPVTAKPYVIKSFVNMTTASPTTGEVAFYLEEYNAAGALLTTQYKKVWSVFGSANPLVREHSFEYTPAAGVASARIQIVIPPNSQETGFIDNVQFWAEDGSTTGNGTVPIGKPGDVNGDNLVNALDLSILLSNWKKTPATHAQGDLSGDGVVNALDLSILLTNWGK
jgi:peptidoglycan/xylan/chitin deacetylase (PgdA/CDA1 family)